MTPQIKPEAFSLASADESFQTLFYLSPIGMAISTMAEGRFVEVNDAYCAITGYARDEIVGRTSVELKLLTPADRQVLLENVRRIGFVRSTDVRLVSASGENRVVAASMHYARFNGDDCIVTTIMDITERKRLEEELEYLAQTDVLSGLSNRRHFMVQAELEMSRCKRLRSDVSVLMLDIDRFKDINDNYGHHVGDLVIHEQGRLFNNLFRDIDIVGRIGGEEFAAILPQSGATAALRAAQRIRQAAADAAIPIDHAEPIHFTVSIGVVSGHGPDIHLDALLERADAALYQAKRDGRNRVCAAPPT